MFSSFISLSFLSFPHLSNVTFHKECWVCCLIQHSVSLGLELGFLDTRQWTMGRTCQRHTMICLEVFQGDWHSLIFATDKLIIVGSHWTFLRLCFLICKIMLLWGFKKGEACKVLSIMPRLEGVFYIHWILCYKIPMYKSQLIVIASGGCTFEILLSQESGVS